MLRALAVSCLAVWCVLGARALTFRKSLGGPPALSTHRNARSARLTVVVPSLSRPAAKTQCGAWPSATTNGEVGANTRQNDPLDLFEEVDAEKELGAPEAESTPRIRTDKSDAKGMSSFGRGLARHELRLMRLIQRCPGLGPVSLAVHYSLLPQVVTPALAMIGWLVSLPAAASLVCFVCAQDVVNTAIKWAVMRPRPLWYSADAGLDAKCGACLREEEADFSFPSAHTQFFSGLAFCACSLSGFADSNPSLGLALGFGSVVGITRIYLGVHWPTDTLGGLILGGGLGALWGRSDPYSWLLRRGSPVLSLGAATGLTAGLVCLLAAVRAAADPADEAALAGRSSDAARSPPPEMRGIEPSSFAPPGPRRIRSKVSVLSTVWCTLAFTALCPAHLPTAASEPAGRAGSRILQAIVGVVGLGGFGLALRRAVVGRPRELPPPSSSGGGTTTALLKALAYAGVCAWTFLLSQLASHRLMALVG